MNELHLHLLFNHFPIMGSFFGLVVLVTGMAMGNSSVKRTGFSLLILTSLFTLPAFFTGEGAEEIVERLPGMTKNIIHEHEEMAELSLWLAEIMGIIAAIALFMDIKIHPFSKFFTIAALSANIICLGSMVKTGNSGGEIRRPEIRSESNIQAIQNDADVKLEHEDH
jgi:hypothetical protein